MREPMAEVNVKGVKGQLERVVDDQGRIYVGEWKGQDVLVLLKPKDYDKLSNERIEGEIASVLKRYKKVELLKEVEKELGLPVSSKGYNPGDGTISSETLAEILLGIWRLKGRGKIDTD